ncbi:VanZ family protein [Rossellomorea marisflavi]|uniref:VanZ family protein n=1 Tax=Rossellomorea marisflavi TaxID=189381 RepID=UPI0020414599|nr:VanZ family protein [Rossellomorea marisflavi]MCM2588249.1 VanZ family protein [Rossellomorea marisflavi]
MKRIIKSIIILSFIVYIAVCVNLLFLEKRTFGSVEITYAQYIRFSSNFIPFRTIWSYVQALFTGSLPLNIPITNLGGNLIAFLPMGLYLPLLFRRMRSVKALILTMTIMILGVESTQLITKTGSFDVDDIILNVSGSLIGYWIFTWDWVQKLLFVSKENPKRGKAA